MNGPEHYLAAELLLAEARDHLDEPIGPFYVEAAKVHAALAQVAATAFPAMQFAGTSGTAGWPSIFKQWADVALVRSAPVGASS